jgi:hypothetical protein
VIPDLALTGTTRKAYIQMRLPHAGAYFAYISGTNFDKLLNLFGVLEWGNDLGAQHGDSR